MSENFDFAHRRQKFVPEPRPEWVRRINEEGRCMDIKSLVPLDEKSLIETAMSNTGLADFGQDDWRERFHVLANAFDAESELNLLGRLMARSDMLIFLQARLQIEDAYNKHPEIEDEKIDSPLYIVGQGRSGTSLLQNLLSMDPHNGTTRTWEIMRPSPPPEKASYFSDPRIAQLKELAFQINRVTPEMLSLHEYASEIPTEVHHVLCLTFGSVGWISATYAQAPSFAAYMQTQSMVPIYEYAKRIMKYLQWKNPRRHWVLKSALCLPHLPDILKVFPDARLVWAHRDPIKALASMVNMVGTLHWSRSERTFIDGFDALTSADVSAQLLSRPIDWLADGTIPKAQLLNVQYLDIVKDPMAVAADIYRHFGIDMTPEGRQGMQKFLDDNPRSSRPPHKYPKSDGDLSAERKAYERYRSYFQVPDEI